jgi:autotransporter-associated beta strand protein
VNTIAGPTPLLLGGTNPTITQSGSASIVIEAPIALGENLTLTGNGVDPDPNHDRANVTFNGPISGNFDITKMGSSTFRFGSQSGTSFSDNTWFGSLTISGGTATALSTIRFNNNAYTAPTALRSNPVALNSANALLTTTFKPLGTDPRSSLRMGTLSGSAGTVEAKRESVTVGAFDSVDIAINTLSNGTFAGTLRNNASGGGDATTGRLLIRGIATQTFSGTLDLAKDVEIGDGATMVLAGSTSLAAQTTTAAVVLNGGTFRLDNTTTNNGNRLRDGATGNTGVETIGGGIFSLVGHSAGTSETVSRLQLGSGSAPRSGALTINVTHSSASVNTVLNFQSYSRDNAGAPLDTVNFTGTNPAGGSLALGGASAGPRVTFSPTSGSFTVPVFNGLLGNTGAGDATSVGWATVNGTDFATYGGNGITATGTSAMPNGTGTGSSLTNALLNGNFTISNATSYSLNSLKMAPTAAGQSLNISSSGILLTNAFLLAGAIDYTIDSSSGLGRIGNAGGTSARYFHVPGAMLTVNAAFDDIVQGPIVKAGAGFLALTNPDNVLVAFPVVINEGTLRAGPGGSLPSGEIRFRGGVLEITGGGTFSRQLGFGVNKITWSGIDSLGVAIQQERGSGGFSAFGVDATVDLSPVTGTTLVWEDPGFINSGYALTFGSTRANAKLTWVDDISLTSLDQNVNYNAREFLAIDNPNSTADVAVLSGTISGTVRDDLMKTGNGELILAGANNYLGATLVTDGVLRVNGSILSSFLTDVRANGSGTGGGVLGGSGTVGPVQVEANGAVAPGNLAGNTSSLNTGAIKFMSGTAKLSIEIGGTTAGGNNTSGYDRLVVTGGITLNGAQLEGTLLNGFTAAPTDLFFIMINDGIDPVQGAFAQGSSITIGSQIFDISYSGNWTGTQATSSFSGGNDVVLRAVPEPATAPLILLGIAGLALRRRK